MPLMDVSFRGKSKDKARRQNMDVTGRLLQLVIGELGSRYNQCGSGTSWGTMNTESGQWPVVVYPANLFARNETMDRV
jgi:hypothetical protein